MSGLPKKYQLAICELFNPYFHGFDNHSDPSIKSQFLVFELIDISDFYNNQYKESSEFLASIYSSMILEILNNHNNNTPHQVNITDIADITHNLPDRLKHPIVRNYANIIKNKNNFTLEIIEKDTLLGNEMVAYKKTFWLRIFQRKWKKIYYRKLRFYKNPKNLFARQINGPK